MISSVSLGILGARVAAMPVTRGLSLVPAAPVAAMTGAEIATIVAVSFIGLALVIEVYKEYEEIEFSKEPPRLKLRKRQ